MRWVVQDQEKDCARSQKGWYKPVERMVQDHRKGLGEDHEMNGSRSWRGGGGFKTTGRMVQDRRKIGGSRPWDGSFRTTRTMF
jgi:hypothetical protein